MSIQVDTITAGAQDLKTLLGKRYGLDFYQREYSWGEAQVVELIDDLVGRFLNEYRPGHVRKEVAGYEPYFLGPIVTAQRGETKYLVDGQQRLTTLSLLLIRLASALEDSGANDLASQIRPLVFSEQYGESSYNLDVDERTKCLDAIRDGKRFDPSDQPESVQNLWARNETIEDRFPGGLEPEQLPFFADWLVNRVFIVDIATPSPEMALEIFESMNDRGLRLSSTDMLKSYLLGRIKNEDAIARLNDEWRRMVRELVDLEKNADSDFLKAWLRGKYADTIREGSNPQPGDYDVIGSAFHKWVRDQNERLGLDADGFRPLVESELLPLGSIYGKLVEATQREVPGLEGVFHLSTTRFTQHLPVLMAAIEPDDEAEVWRAKAQLITSALDIYLARRIVNYRQSGHSTVKGQMFRLGKALRRRSLDEIRPVLAEWLDEETERFDNLAAFRMHKQNRRSVRYLLARMNAWLLDELDQPGSFSDFVARTKNPYEVEHILANHPERHLDEFPSAHDFDLHRNSFGGLLLLTKDFNASYGDKPYSEKWPLYGRDSSPLVKSLHPTFYGSNPRFERMRETHDLDFVPHEEFDRQAMEQRQHLYQQLVQVIWDPAQRGLVD